MRLKTLVGAALAALALSAPAEALAENVHAKVTIKSKRTVGKDTIFGRVISKERACEVNRKVRVIVTRPDRSRNRVAAVKTNGKGRWKYVPKSGKSPGGYTNEGDRYADPGNYRAKIADTKASTGDGRVTCRASKSSAHYVG